MPQRRCRMQGGSLRGRVRSFLVRTRATSAGLVTITFLKCRIVIASGYHIYHVVEPLCDYTTIIDPSHTFTPNRMGLSNRQYRQHVEQFPSCSDSAFLMVDFLSGLIRKGTKTAHIARGKVNVRVSRGFIDTPWNPSPRSYRSRSWVGVSSAQE
jgi:hypothetical protein